jgi:asparagine N-glycosylation enzyme membrane subunit Stt3
MVSAASMVLLAQLLHEIDAIGSFRGRRVASALMLAMAGLALPLLVFEPLREALLFAVGWFTHGEESLGLIFEMQPILAIAGRFDPSFAIIRFGAGFIVLPLVWIYLVWRAIEKRSAPQGLILFWALAFMILTLRQWRFGNTLAVVYAVLLGAVLAEWIPHLRRRIAQRPLRPVLEISMVLILLGWSCIAFADFYQPIIRKSIGALASEEQRNFGPLHPGRKIYDEAGRWIAKHTPKTSGYLDASLAPEYAVLANTSVGHLLRYRAERPMIQDNFGPYAGRRSFDAAAAYYASRDEEAAIGILEGLGVRYVIGGAGGAGSTAGLGADAMALRLWLRYGSFGALRNGRSVPGLNRHRLVFHADTASRRMKSRSLSGPPRFEGLGVWEIVPGAKIEGHAKPRTRVRLSLQLTTTSNANHVYRRRTFADDEGRYEFVVPYSTDVAFSPDVRAVGSYRLESSGVAETLLVREEDVLSGAIVHGPDL